MQMPPRCIGWLKIIFRVSFLQRCYRLYTWPMHNFRYKSLKHRFLCEIRVFFFTAVSVTFLVLSPCRLSGSRRFGKTHYLHLQPWRGEQYVSPKRLIPDSLQGSKTCRITSINILRLQTLKVTLCVCVLQYNVKTIIQTHAIIRSFQFDYLLINAMPRKPRSQLQIKRKNNKQTEQNNTNQQ